MARPINRIDPSGLFAITGTIFTIVLVIAVFEFTILAIVLTDNGLEKMKLPKCEDITFRRRIPKRKPDPKKRPRRPSDEDPPPIPPDETGCAFSGYPECSSEYSYSDAREACIQCAGPGYRPGNRTPMDESTDGIIFAEHIRCLGPDEGYSVICGDCCEEDDGGNASIVNRCKCTLEDFDDDIIFW